MAIRVPLIWPVDAVIHRLDIQSTWEEDPSGTPDTGFDPILREPYIVHDTDTNTRSSMRQELAAVRVPVQVRFRISEQLKMAYGIGNDPIANIVFIAHRQDLETLGLLDATSRNCLLKAGDRISQLERKGLGVVVRVFDKPLYVYRVDDGSQGFGIDGYDLQVIWTSHRQSAPM